MKTIISRLKFAYNYIVNSIGFYPTIISLFFFGLALLMLYSEARGLSDVFKDQLPFMIITNHETARLILSTIAAGIISLTVFSFTMVMLVLNQAAANFSPRVIPGLISYKSNQRVLGLYLGTLIYTLVVMVNVRAEYYSIALPGFAVFLAMCLTIVCLGFFVYFIHSISQSIQIESILENIYHITKRTLNKEIDRDRGPGIPNVFSQTDDWQMLRSPKTGYLQSMDEEVVLEMCRKRDIVLYFEEPLGSFLIEGVPFARVNKHLDDMDEFAAELFKHVSFYREELPDANYIFGFKHITESAVKALSPGINDPGTAIKAIDYLTSLLAVRMQLTDEKVLYDEESAARISFRHETFEELQSTCLSPIRLYGKGSGVIVMRMLHLFKSLLFKVEEYPHLKTVIYKEMRLLVYDADTDVLNPGDRDKINKLIKQLNGMLVLDELLPMLKQQDKQGQDK